MLQRLWRGVEAHARNLLARDRRAKLRPMGRRHSMIVTRRDSLKLAGDLGVALASVVPLSRKGLQPIVEGAEAGLVPMVLVAPRLKPQWIRINTGAMMPNIIRSRTVSRRLRKA